MNTTLESMSPILVEGVLVPLATYLRSKGVEITVEEMAQALLLPIRPAVQPPVVAPPAVEKIAIPATRTRTAREKSAVVLDTEKTCQHVYTRKTKQYEKGQICGKPALQGGDYCPECAVRKKKSLPAGAGSDIASNASSNGKEKASSSGAGDSGSNSTSSSIRKERQIAVEPMEDRPGFFREIGNNFYLEKASDNTLYVHGVFDDSDEVRPLNETEKRLALDMGLKLRDVSPSSLAKPTLKALPGMD